MRVNLQLLPSLGTYLPGPDCRKTMASGSGSESEEDMWGDLHDEELLILATQDAEAQQAEKARLQLSQLTGNGQQTATSEPTMNPTEAAHMFAYRRNNLVQTQGSEGVQFASTPPILNANSTEKLIAELAAEKERNKDLTNKLEAATGESCNLRRHCDSLRREKHQDAFEKWKRERELTETHLREKRKLSNEVDALRTLLKKKSVDEVNAASKQAMYAVTRAREGRLSVGGAGSSTQSQFQSQWKNKTSKAASPTAYKCRSDPNLGQNSSQKRQSPQSQTDASMVAPVTPPSSQSPTGTKDGPVRLAKHAQVDAIIMERERIDKLLFEGENGTIDVGKTESISCLKIFSKRKEIFHNLRGVLQRDYRCAAPVLERIIRKAPREIMARFAPGPDIKTCFPDVIDSIFLYGTQEQKKKESGERNEYGEQKYPKLASLDLNSYFDLEDLVSTLETQFVYGNSWQALKEAKLRLKVLLEGLQGEARFQLYQRPKLEALWHLLAWSEQFWKLIHFEEECDIDGIKQKYGVELWKKELVEWTGLILKVDYRDFYALELEAVIRAFSLGILESIVVTGYFEEVQKRYEILYCILKDTLMKDHIRNQRLVTKCLIITNWSVSKRKIFNYLCIRTQNGKCLARLFGENVLKCFNEIRSPQDAATLMAHYLSLLESLMMEQPPNYCVSKVLRSNQGNPDDDDAVAGRNNLMDVDMPNFNEGDMDDSIASTQYADLDKYKYDEGARERAERFNNTDPIVSCWINPKEWEIPIDFSGTHKPCQCRKVLVGSAFTMLHSIFELWKTAYKENEERIEKLDIEDQKRLQTLMENRSKGPEETLEEQTLVEKRKMIRDFTLAEFNSDFDGDDENAGGHELTWDVLLKHRKTSLPSNAKLDWTEERQRPENIFDIVLRRGALLLTFCNAHSVNLALAIGSEAFIHYTLVEQNFKFFQDTLGVEQCLLLERGDSRNESNEHKEASTSIFDYLIESDDNDNAGFLPEFDEKLIFENLPKAKNKKPGKSQESFLKKWKQMNEDGM